MNKLTYNNEGFFLDGNPFTILSGAIHYFRIPREYWHDRLAKLKACGLNTVETYTCWNLHERREGEFNFSGDLDIAAFIDEAASLGLKVILRPGPYICAEWEFGGLPSWLLTYPKMQLRCCDNCFLDKTKRYFTALFDHLRGRLACDGGNIIMVQAENEYGSYGNDHRYMQAIAEIYSRCGVNVPLFTSDGPCGWMFNGGMLYEKADDGTEDSDNFILCGSKAFLATANFGSRAGDAFDFLEANLPDQPKMCGEFWCGWFDHWHTEHHVRNGDDIVSELDTILDRGGSFNIYMFCGGTNFGFTNGANYDDAYQPTVTSYDYNAPLSESGDMTPKYYAVKNMLEKRFGPAPDIDVKNSEKRSYGSFKPDAHAPLFENLHAFPAPVKSAMPMTMEEIGQDFGFTLYRTVLCGDADSLPIITGEPRDRVHIFIDGKLRAIKERARVSDDAEIRLPKGESHSLDILTENMGRINYGPMMRDEKGLVSGVRLGQQFHFGWTQQALRMEKNELDALKWRPIADVQSMTQPTFLRFTFSVDEPADTFLRLDGFTHGFASVNGHNLGRFYNTAGPQKTLYLPAPWLKKGENELIVFETDEITEDACAVFTDEAELG